jgi:urease accessory protein
MTTSDYKLLAWLSPAYPVGSYAFSHGLENAVETGLVECDETAQDWIADLLLRGGGFADLAFAANAWNMADDSRELGRLNDYALAFQTTSELRLETTEQGRAFADVSAVAWPSDAVARLASAVSGRLAYPVAVGVTARAHAVAQRAMLTAYAHAFAVRLVPLGQTAGQRMTAWLATPCETAARRAAETGYENVATLVPMAEITSMNHEQQYTRLFRS